MGSEKSYLSPSEIAELQRDCHPFPDYINFINGQPTAYERLMEGPGIAAYSGRDDRHSVSAPVAAPNDLASTSKPGVAELSQLRRTSSSHYSTAPAPNPTTRSYRSPQSMYAGPPPSISADAVARQTPPEPAGLGNQSSFLNLLPGSSPALFAEATVGLPGQMRANHMAGRHTTLLTTETAARPQSMLMGASQPQISLPSSAPPRNPALDAYPALRAPKPDIPLLQRNDMLKPGYDFMSQHVRFSTNRRVAQLRDIIDVEEGPTQACSAAMSELVQLCMRVHLARQKELYRILHHYMPRVYDALAFLNLCPNAPEAAQQRHFLTTLQQQFKGPMWDYMMRLFSEMDKKRLQGKVPYEAIPGWLENWNKEHQPKEPKGEAVMQGGELKQSKGESSPLPHWKGY